jgi:urease gamma subunit
MAKKIKIPKSVIDLKLSPKKFAKKNNIKLKGKGLSKKEKNRNKRKLKTNYCESVLNGLNKAVMILSENPSDNKKVIKVKKAIDKIIPQSNIMGKVAKLYNKNPKDYPNMIYLPSMIVNTIEYYSHEGINDEDKAIGEKLNKEELLSFCGKILKKKIRKYEKSGLSTKSSFILSTVIPNTKLLKNNRQSFKNLIQSLYKMAEDESVELSQILKAIKSLDNKKDFNKKEFYRGFFSEFILSRASNKDYSFNEYQKQLREDLIEKTLDYLNKLKTSETREILKKYIKHRKTAEEYKNDTKRVIKFIDYANSNSVYTNLQAVIKDLIADNSSNELYLS